MPDIGSRRLEQTARASADKILNREALRSAEIGAEQPVLVILAAGKGTRFGLAPKCVQSVCGIPLARHSIDAFRAFSSSQVICLVGYRFPDVVAALGDDNIYVRSENPTGGTAFAAFEAFSVEELRQANPLLIITMGDRIVTTAVFKRLVETHSVGPRAADLTFLSAIYEPPKNRGKGRVVRDEQGKIVRIIEQRDIDVISDGPERQKLHIATEGNCPLYAIRAQTLLRYLSRLDNNNAQRQYYFTDIVEAIHRDGGDIRTITTTLSDPDYDLLCSDVTRPIDLALLEGILSSTKRSLSRPTVPVEEVAQAIAVQRPAGQIASIAAQLEELVNAAMWEDLGFEDDRPIGIGISGGRLRIAFMHPDMGRFYGPAWQMPIGAQDEEGREQIVVLIQSTDDGKIRLHPTNPQFREKLNYVSADEESMYPGNEIADWYSYEGFGTRMAENLLLSLGYFTEQELQVRRENGQPLPPPSLWVSNSMRRPFSLIGNAIASMRTLREGSLGAKAQTFLGRDGFRGLNVMSTGSIPQGGFSSSSAVTVAVKNAINALFDLGIHPDMLVHLACQAEYGTGVRAGALDQATEQNGRPCEGALISSNPRENYRIIGTYPVPAERIRVLFPYSVDRDREAWKWSFGTYAATGEPGRLTAAEMRKMTGKSSELAAILTRLSLDTDLFQPLESDLVKRGALSEDNCKWVYNFLQQLPLCATQAELRERIRGNREWYIEQLMEVSKRSVRTATQNADATFEGVFSGWRDPTLTRATPTGTVVDVGAPLRAMVGYLFGEVAKNCHLIHHPDKWIEYVSRSQWGDRCFDIEAAALPSRDQMMGDMAWEKAVSGPQLMDKWMQRFKAIPFDYNSGLDDESLSMTDPRPLHLIQGSNFFRGLALIDLAEAMLKRAFGDDAVAVRINAAGQGDYFQVHVDGLSVDAEEVKEFIRTAFYRRFGLAPEQEFVEPHSGGGAVGVRLHRFDELPELILDLREYAQRSSATNSIPASQ